MLPLPEVYGLCEHQLTASLTGGACEYMNSCLCLRCMGLHKHQLTASLVGGDVSLWTVYKCLMYIHELIGSSVNLPTLLIKCQCCLCLRCMVLRKQQLTASLAGGGVCLWTVYKCLMYIHELIGSSVNLPTLLIKCQCCLCSRCMVLREHQLTASLAGGGC